MSTSTPAPKKTAAKKAGSPKSTTVQTGGAAKKPAKKAPAKKAPARKKVTPVVEEVQTVAAPEPAPAPEKLTLKRRLLKLLTGM